jgi:hypothetical protein
MSDKARLAELMADKAGPVLASVSRGKTLIEALTCTLSRMLP